MNISVDGLNFNFRFEYFLLSQTSCKSCNHVHEVSSRGLTLIFGSQIVNVVAVERGRRLNWSGCTIDRFGSTTCQKE